MKTIHQQLLETLIKHPLISPEQLGVLLAAWPNRVRDELKVLRAQGWVERINPHSPEIGPRALFYPTRTGVKALTDESGIRCDLAFKRLAELWLVIERVYRVRNIMLTMTKWEVRDWEVELDVRRQVRGKALALHLHGAGIAFAVTGTIPFAIEYDTGVLPLDAQKVRQWVEWQLAPPFIGRGNEVRFPVFLIIAPDANRLSGYYTLMRAAALARGLPLPRAYFTTTAALAHFGVTAPIWYASTTGAKTTLFAEVRSAPADLSDLQCIGIRGKSSSTSANPSSLTLAELDGRPRTPLSQWVQLKSRLAPQEKRVLNEIGAHPMLAASEISLLRQEAPWRVKAALGALERFKLIEAHRRDEETRFVVSNAGVQYLAACAGFGRAAKRYARARGWKHGTRSMIRHWEHTKAENQFFLQFAQAAQKHGGYLTWRSELECCLYYEARGRRRSFLPDGEGIYRDSYRRIHFALEIERGRTSLHKLRVKLTQYYAFMESRLFRQTSGGEFRLFMVTTSWPRALKLRRIALELAQQWGMARLPLWITTFNWLRAESLGVGAAIWRGIDKWERCHCIESWNDAGNSREARPESIMNSLKGLSKGTS